MSVNGFGHKGDRSLQMMERFQFSVYPPMARRIRGEASKQGLSIKAFLEIILNKYFADIDLEERVKADIKRRNEIFAKIDSVLLEGICDEYAGSFHEENESRKELKLRIEKLVGEN